MSVFDRVHMPPLDGATEWLNSGPLGPVELRGRVVLVNFWTLTCINWLRQEPYVRAWSQAYRDDGLVVIGVHTPEFAFDLRTPETYLGYARSVRFASPGGAALDERSTYALPEELRLNHWALAGAWTIRRENVALENAGGSIAYRFHARDAHLVLRSVARSPIPLRVLLDGEAPGASRGCDVDNDGRGLLREGRLYQLIRQHDVVRERTLEIVFAEPGAEAYVFTFG